MNIVNRELCATCPERSALSKIAAKIILGSEFNAEDCTGMTYQKEKLPIFSTNRSIPGTMATFSQTCNKNEQDENTQQATIYEWPTE